jgi:glycosyltransferase involved in cell wall biosynthesis
MISVVIASYNRRALLERTLRALEEGRVPAGGVEVLVADNGSTDGTAELLAAERARGRLDLRIVTVAEPGKSVALNAAMPQARGSILAFTDDDVVPEPGWLEAIGRAFEDPAVDFVAGRILPLWEAPPPAWLSPALYGVIAVADGGPERRAIDSTGSAVMPIGTNFAVRRRVIERLGGWRTDLGKLRGTLRTGEDHEFFVRMLRGGYRGVYEPEARVAHLVPAGRLRRDYFRAWFHGNGRVVALLEEEYPTARRYVLGVPGYLWRAAAADAGRAVRAAVTGHAPDRFASLVRLHWFLGYLRQCWRLRLRPGLRPTPEPTA